MSLLQRIEHLDRDIEPAKVKPVSGRLLEGHPEQSLIFSGPEGQVAPIDLGVTDEVDGLLGLPLVDQATRRE